MDINEKNHELEELENGELYVFKNGNLEHIKRDPDDNLIKVRITDDSSEVLKAIQKKLRKEMNGYKPDITMVASALLESFANKEEEAIECVKAYGKKMFD